MHPKRKNSADIDLIDRAFTEGTVIEEAIAEAVRDARRQHKLAGNPIAEWRDGKVFWVAPEDIELE